MKTYKFYIIKVSLHNIDLSIYFIYFKDIKTKFFMSQYSIQDLLKIF